MRSFFTACTAPSPQSPTELTQHLPSPATPGVAEWAREAERLAGVLAPQRARAQCPPSMQLVADASTLQVWSASHRLQAVALMPALEPPAPLLGDDFNVFTPQVAPPEFFANQASEAALRLYMAQLCDDASDFIAARMRVYQDGPTAPGAAESRAKLQRDAHRLASRAHDVLAHASPSGAGDWSRRFSLSLLRDLQGELESHAVEGL